MANVWSRIRVVVMAFALAAIGWASPGGAAEPYLVGYITDLSGPLAESYTPTWEGFELHVKAVNERGGVKGRPVRAIIEDDRLNPARAVAMAKKLATENNVLAIFGLSLSSTHGPVYEEMRKAGVPVVTGFSGIADALPPAKDFAYSAGVVFEVSGEVAGELLPRIIKPGAMVVGMTIDTVGGRALLRHNKPAAEALGYKWDEAIFPVRTVDFSPYAQVTVAKKPDVVVGHYGAEQNLGVIPALRRQGYSGPYVVAVYGVSEHVIREAMKRAGSEENIYQFNRYATINDDVPAVKEVKAAADKFGTGRPFSTMHVQGWVLAKVGLQALDQCGWPCTREKLNGIISNIQVDTQGLTGGPIKFSPGDHYGTTYWRLSKWNAARQAFEPVGDWIQQTKPKYLQR